MENKCLFFFLLNGYTNAETGPGVKGNRMVTSRSKVVFATDLKLLVDCCTLVMPNIDPGLLTTEIVGNAV